MQYGQKKMCPYCGGTDFTPIDSKFYFTKLLKCRHCGLLHRHPKDDRAWLEKFYQRDYEIDTAMMTSLPDAKLLAGLKQNNFSSLRDYSPYLKALAGQSHRILDYGCSWGYNVYKLKHSGFNASGFELSVPRAQFGENNLEVKIFSNLEHIPSGFDIVFTSHVLEHLHSIPDFLKFSRRILHHEGILVAFVPNGSAAYRTREPDIFHVNWGAVHPNFLDAEFAAHMFRENPYLILTGDWDFDVEKISAWDGRSQTTGTDLSGKELLIVAKPNIKL
jgi:SAM-dependent methyltransferase